MLWCMPLSLSDQTLSLQRGCHPHWRVACTELSSAQRALTLPHVQQTRSWLWPAGAAEKQRMERAAQEVYGAPALGGGNWLASGIAGAAGRAWSYITDEATMLDAAAPNSAARPEIPIELTIDLQGEQHQLHPQLISSPIYPMRL